MREILFRGKRVDNGEWVVSDSFYQCHGRIKLWDEQNRDGYVEVEKETVGQYTGLTDKNGKKVYEGDIVKFTDTTFGYSHVGEVCFNKGSFCILYELYGQKRFHRIGKTEEWQDMGASGTITYSYEVIGDIHDNKELLDIGE